MRQINSIFNTSNIMKQDENKISKATIANTNDPFPGYPVYPASEDIYSNFKEEADLNPEDLSKTKTPNEKTGKLNEKDFGDDVTGSDLDVPGSELNEDEESIGTEDEENDYYSLGGDNHNDLEEDRII